jgi:hypothetical protein
MNTPDTPRPYFTLPRSFDPTEFLRSPRLLKARHVGIRVCAQEKAPRGWQPIRRAS